MPHLQLAFNCCSSLKDASRLKLLRRLRLRLRSCAKIARQFSHVKRVLGLLQINLKPNHNKVMVSTKAQARLGLGQGEGLREVALGLVKWCAPGHAWNIVMSELFVTIQKTQTSILSCTWTGGGGLEWGAWHLAKEVSGSLSTRLRLIKLHCECHCKVSKMRLAAGRRNHSAGAGQEG